MFQNYLAVALRNLARNGQYAGITIAGLAIAFAAAILIGLYVRDELSYDRWVPGAERVFLLNYKITGVGQPVDSDSTPEALADLLKLDFPQVEYAARAGGAGFPPAVRRGDINLSERNFDWVDPDFFKIFRVKALAGDPAVALASPDALVLSKSAARRYFGVDAPIGGVLQVDGQPMRVAAVIEDLPSNSSLVGDVFGSARANGSSFKQFSGGGMMSNIGQTFVRLKPGASAADVEAALPRFVQMRMLPDVRRYSSAVRLALHLKPLRAIHLHPGTQGDAKPGGDPTVVAAIGVIGALIVIVAAINFVTLMTACAARRAVEVGVRKALGASRRDLIAQFLGESGLYVAVALLFAVAIAELTLPAVNAVLQRQMQIDYFGDPWLTGSLLAVGVLVALLAGLYPAFVLSAFRPSVVLKGGPVESAGGGRVRQLLVVAQFSVLIALLVCAATIYRQTTYALTGATHVNQDQVALLLATPCTTTLRDAVAALPGVRGAACASPYALNLADNRDKMQANGLERSVATASVDFGFFEVYGVRPIVGRLFSVDRPADDGAVHQTDAPPVVINASAVRTLGFASPQAALGKSVAWHFIAEPYAGLKGDPNRAPRPSEIVGVVPDFTLGSVRQPIEPTLYFVGMRNSVMSSVALNVKLDGARVAETLAAIDRTWKRVNPGQPLQRVFASQFMLRLYIDTIVQGAFVAVCALIAVSIACLGLFALSAYTAERRTKEIGVRKAMGASSGDILALLLRQFLWPVLVANLIAWPLAFMVMNWWLQGFAYRIDQSPLTFIAAGAGAVLIALATVFFHGLRVARAKPVSALRYE
ncbi:MAG TPA: FtsX-like permease family protein [Caulobacteraceae bacterium]|jgi:putative ABC transport system permease protein|nr:FtsX-like permease family protein [Caulobacteraceae bacterium]